MEFKEMIKDVKRYRQVIDNPIIHTNKNLKKADMHVHSCFGKEFLPGGKIGGENYAKLIDRFVDVTRVVLKIRHPKKQVKFNREYEIFFRLNHKPIELFNIAMQRGMDFFTITDHDTIDGCLDLMDNHPKTKKKLIVGEEVSSLFPKENFPVHLCVYDIDGNTHKEMHEVNSDVTELVKFLKEKKKIHSLNHLGNNFWGGGKKFITPKIISKCLNSFDIFEARNGNVPVYMNTANTILFLLYNKGLVAGSDTHNGGAGIAYTAAFAEDKKEFLEAIRQHQTYIYGEHGTRRAYKQHFLQMYSTSLLFFNDKLVDLSKSNFYSSVLKLANLYVKLRSGKMAKKYYKDHIEGSKITHKYLTTSIKMLNKN